MENGIFPSVKRRFLQVDRWCIWRDIGSLRCFGQSPKTGMRNTGRLMTFRWTKLLGGNWRSHGWGDEVYHRRTKQWCGIERAQVRKAVAQRITFMPCGHFCVWRCTSCEQELVGMRQRYPLSGMQYALIWLILPTVLPQQNFSNSSVCTDIDSSYLQSYPNCVSPNLYEMRHSRFF